MDDQIPPAFREANNARFNERDFVDSPSRRSLILTHVVNYANIGRYWQPPADAPKKRGQVLFHAFRRANTISST